MMILLLENHKYCFKFSTGLERGRESIQKYCFGSKWFLIILVKKKTKTLFLYYHQSVPFHFHDHSCRRAGDWASVALLGLRGSGPFPEVCSAGLFLPRRAARKPERYHISSKQPLLKPPLVV